MSMKKIKRPKLTEEQRQRFWMEAGARFAIEYMAEEGMFDAGTVAVAMQELIKRDVKDGLGKKFLL